jgi:hypothetical protein
MATIYSHCIAATYKVFLQLASKQYIPLAKRVSHSILNFVIPSLRIGFSGDVMGVGDCGASLLGSHNKQESSAPLASHITTPSAN